MEQQQRAMNHHMMIVLMLNNLSQVITEKESLAESVCLAWGLSV